MKLIHSPLAMIALGGALGALSRFYLSFFIDAHALRFGQLFQSIKIDNATNLGSGNTVEFLSHPLSSFPSIFLFFSLFPLGVLLVNMLGSLALGIFLTRMEYTESNYTKTREAFQRNISLRNFLVVGFLGSFTTFSTFIMDSIESSLPFLFTSTALNEIFPRFKDVADSFERIFPSYSHNLVTTHSFLFALSNIILNIVLCLFCVWLGHTLMKRHYTTKKNIS